MYIQNEGKIMNKRKRIVLKKHRRKQRKLSEKKKLFARTSERAAPKEKGGKSLS
jgi:hypothetical protein